MDNSAHRSKAQRVPVIGLFWLASVGLNGA